jgi:hypothetical protein
LDDFNNLGFDDKNSIGDVKEILLRHAAMLDEIEAAVNPAEADYKLDEMKRLAVIQDRAWEDNGVVVSDEYDRLWRTATYIRANVIENWLDLNEPDERQYAI